MSVSLSPVRSPRLLLLTAAAWSGLAGAAAAQSQTQAQKAPEDVVEVADVIVTADTGR